MDVIGLDPVGSLERLERPLWIAAVATYGVGDAATTVAGLSMDDGVAEAGPVAAALLEGYGIPAFLALKVATIALFYAVWTLLRTPSRAAVPLALVVVGGLATGWNVLVILSAWSG